MTFVLGEQARETIEARPPMLILGGPGSGKTTLSILKTKRSIPSLQPGQQVLFLSFSRAAVQQVLTRCKDALTPDERRRIDVKTYHAFAMEILLGHGRLLTGNPPRIYFPGPEKMARSRFDGDWEEERHRLAETNGQYTFDLFAEYASSLLTRCTSVRDLISDRYPIVILDEFQDTDDAQWGLVQALAPACDLIALADPDQRIFDYDPRVDPERLNQFRSTFEPAEFDLGEENHRSPDAHVLNFADAVLRNRPLPESSDVDIYFYRPANMDGAVRAVITWTLAKLGTSGIVNPSVAVLCRTNDLVGRVSRALSTDQKVSGRVYPALSHHVVWDAELTLAAAQVVASILQWPQLEASEAAATTLDSVADFFDMKNATRPSQSALASAKSYRAAAAAVRSEKQPRTDASRDLVRIAKHGIDLVGDPVADWKLALRVVGNSGKLGDIHGNARFVRMFRATEDLGGQLAQQWIGTATYGDAREIVRRTLSRAQVMSSAADPRGVVLMNMHKSKGKEFDAVVLVEGSHSGKFIGDRPELHDADRRLLRVGITRAKHRVAFVRPRGANPLVSPPVA